MINKVNRKVERVRRHERVRAKVTGTPERPRLSIYRSLTNIYAQVIDDANGTTLVSASSLDVEIKKTLKFGGNKEAAKAVGALIAKKSIEKGIKNVVFDRGGVIYHGRVKELAEASREAGLEF